MGAERESEIFFLLILSTASSSLASCNYYSLFLFVRVDISQNDYYVVVLKKETKEQSLT